MPAESPPAESVRRAEGLVAYSVVNKLLFTLEPGELGYYWHHSVRHCFPRRNSNAFSVGEMNEAIHRREELQV